MPRLLQMAGITPEDIVYISGPMTGIAQANKPAFFAMQRRLEACGCQVLNPAIHPDGLSWAQYMRLDIPMVCQATVVVLLPGHHRSRGATVERLVARALGVRFVYAYWRRRPLVETMASAAQWIKMLTGGMAWLKLIRVKNEG